MAPSIMRGRPFSPSYASLSHLAAGSGWLLDLLRIHPYSLVPSWDFYTLTQTPASRHPASMQPTDHPRLLGGGCVWGDWPMAREGALQGLTSPAVCLAANGQCCVYLRNPPAPRAWEGAHQGGAVQVHPADPGAGAEGELRFRALWAWVRPSRQLAEPPTDPGSPRVSFPVEIRLRQQFCAQEILPGGAAADHHPLPA